MPRTCLVLSAILATLLGASTASAATFTVNSTADTADADTANGVCSAGTPTGGPCTLRAALLEAQTTPGDTIVLPAGTYTPASGYPIASDVTVQGAGAASTVIDGQGVASQLLACGTGTCAFSGVTVRRKGSGGSPGLIYIGNANVTVSDVVLRDNVQVGQPGGGILSGGGSLTVLRSSIVDNAVTGSFEAGGIYSSGSLSIVDSLIARNTASRGAGITVPSGGSLSVLNSTISGNETVAAPGTGGAIELAGGPASLTHVTVADNAGFGSIDRGGSTLTLRDTILGPTRFRPVCVGVGTVTTLGRNVIADTSCGAASPPGRTIADPLLRPLADNGGPTATMALRPGSPALDAALGACPATDQRGVSRPVGAACDVGAFEGVVADPPAPTVEVPGPTVTVPGPERVVTVEAPPAVAPAPRRPSVVSARLTQSGVRVVVRVGGAGRVAVRATRGGRLLASGQATASRAGTVTVLARPTRAGRRALRARSVSGLRLTATFAAQGPSTMSPARTLTVRR